MNLLCENFKAIENYFDIEIKHRGDEFEISRESSLNDIKNNYITFEIGSAGTDERGEIRIMVFGLKHALSILTNIPN